MIKIIHELIEYKDLIYMIVLRDIKIKYKQSIMGFMWAILMPVIIISAGVLVKFAMARLSGGTLTWAGIASVSVKSVPWAFFVASIRFATNCMTSNTNLVAKIYFPREILPISAVLSQLFDFLVASCVLTIIMCIAHIGLSVYLLWVPFLFLLMVINALSMGIFLSVSNLFLRDVKYLVEVILSFAIFFTPVFYESEVAGKWAWLIMLNPVAPVLEGINSSVVLHQMPKIGWLLYSCIFAIVSLILSVVIFKKLEPKFAENI
jgi:lipopolysaccharide transport system permease protein